MDHYSQDLQNRIAGNGIELPRRPPMKATFTKVPKNKAKEVAKPVKQLKADCSVPDCVAEAYARSLCRNHYNKQRAENAGNCTIAGCVNKSRNKGLCPTHLYRKKQGIPMDRPIAKSRPRGSNPAPCSVDGCDSGSVTKGLCPFHYQRLRNGTPLDAPLHYRAPK